MSATNPFFNNKSKTDPIFIVIDRCPGGSGMEGARIVQAIKTSPAPVHVVVKSYAASMAAIILAQADHSYAFRMPLCCTTNLPARRNMVTLPSRANAPN